MHEIEMVAAHGPTTEEMQKLHNQMINDTARGRQASMNRAQHIAEYALYDGDPDLVNSELDELLAIRPDQIRKVVSEFLDTDNRVLLDVVPEAQA
jgi:zinc protease